MNPENPFAERPTTPTPPGQFPQQPPAGFSPAPQPPQQPQQPFSTPAPMPQTPGYIPTPQPQAQPSAPTPSPYPTPAPLPSGTQPDQYSVDYLNQIAPKEQRTVNRFAVFGLIGGVLMALVVAIVIMANAGGPDFSSQAKSIQSRITTLQTVADAEQPNLKENAISEANSALSSALTSMNADLTALMKAKGIKASSSSSATITKTEKTYAAALQKKLDDSYQRGTLDRTYTTQMTYELTLLRSQLTKLKNTANSKSVAAFCNSAVTNIDTILKAYGNFSATK
jgi:hypothetical protein